MHTESTATSTWLRRPLLVVVALFICACMPAAVAADDKVPGAAASPWTVAGVGSGWSWDWEWRRARARHSRGLGGPASAVVTPASTPAELTALIELREQNAGKLKAEVEVLVSGKCQKAATDCSKPSYAFCGNILKDATCAVRMRCPAWPLCGWSTAGVTVAVAVARCLLHRSTCQRPPYAAPTQADQKA